MATRSKRVSLSLAPQEIKMLEQLCKALNQPPSEVLRTLIHDAYAEKLPRLKSRAGFGFWHLLPEPSRVTNDKNQAAKKAPRKQAKASRAGAAPTAKRRSKA